MTASVTAAITKTRDSIDDILAEDSPPDNMLSETEIKTMIKELVTEARKGGKIGMFKMAAAAIGGAAALKILASMFGGGDDFASPDLDGVGHAFDGEEYVRPRRPDFGPNLFPRDPQKPGGPAPDHEDFW